MEEHLAGLEVAEDFFADAYWCGGFSHAGEALEGFGFGDGFRFHPLLETKTRGAGLVVRGHERAKWIHLLRFMKGRLKRARWPECQRQAGGRFEGLQVVAENRGALEMCDDAAVWIAVGNGFVGGGKCDRLHESRIRHKPIAGNWSRGGIPLGKMLR